MFQSVVPLSKKMLRLPEWRYMSLRTKRLILLPVIAFAALGLIRAYTPLILIGLIVWFLYKWTEKRR